MNQIIRKLTFFFIIQVIFYNLLYLIFIPELYTIPQYLVLLILYYIITLIDAVIRPLEDDGGDPPADKYTLILVILFLSNPFFLIASFYERNVLVDIYIPWFNNIGVTVIGALLFIISGIFIILGRLQLGKYATGTLGIQEHHELMDRGIYKYVRHPIYGSSIIGGFVTFLAYNSLLTPIFYTLVMFLVLNQRANYEETILLNEFGQTYEKYVRKTKKFIPFVY